MKEESKNYKFKKNDNDISLSRRDEVKVMTVALTQQAIRKVDILSLEFDASVYDNPDFIEAIKQLSVKSKFTRIRILIKSSDHMVKYSHRMIPLIQQLTSTIEVRCLSEEYSSQTSAFAVFDGKGVIYLNHADDYNGIANFDRPRLATELTNYFDELWEHSVPEVNLRRLHI